jgi:hypothetical protein
MRESVFDARGRWVVASATALVMIGVVLLLFRLPAPTTSFPSVLSPPPPKPMLTMARPDDSDLLLKEEAQLRDLRPLFLPTDRNAALPEPRLEPGRTFLENETLRLMFTDAEAQLSKDLPPVVRLNAKPVDEATPVDALSPVEAGFALEGFGRREAATSKFEQRGGYVEVAALKDGRQLFEWELPIAARPPSDKAWSPVEFIAVVDPAGLVSPLAVTTGSRVEEVDAHFRSYLAQNFRIGERLSPGFYRITVAP